MKPSRDPLQSIVEKVADHRILDGLRQASAALVFALLSRRKPGLYVWLCRNNREAEEVAANLRFFESAEDSKRILVLPGFEADPYRGLSPHPDIAETRAVSLWKLLRGHQGFVITTLHSLVGRLPSPDRFLKRCIHLEVGSLFPMDPLLARLREMGYLREDPVNEMGEFSHRGGIVDVFSPAHANPVRIEFFGDRVESIRGFDSSTQRSTTLIPGCQLIPMREVVTTPAEVAHWTARAPEYWSEVRFAEALSEKLQFTQNGELFNGFEYLFPLVAERERGLLDYLDAGDDLEVSFVLPRPEEFFNSLDQLQESLVRSFEDRQAGGELALPFHKLFFSSGAVREWIQRKRTFEVHELWEESGPVCRFEFRPERHYRNRIQDILADIESWGRKGEAVLFVMNSKGMAERLVNILGEYEIDGHLVARGLDRVLGPPIAVTHGALSEGFYSPLLKLHLLTQENVFEESRFKPAVRKTRKRDVTGAFLSDFRDLKYGDYVVHVDHGIGLFRGLKQIGVGGSQREFVEIAYQKEAKLYVPVERLDLLQKFRGAESAKPQIDRLGGVSWKKTKRRIKQSVQQLAQDLLKLYARRAMAEGHAFSRDDELAREFEEAFVFEETADQIQAIRDVKRDMESSRPMDRLVCGDVGYGKTEVAMRAAFKAVNDNRQVSVLAPTTVLAYQHYNTFRERFRGFPVNVSMLSRFQNRRQQAEVIERTAAGLVDVLIGTHRLLSKDVKFRRLGLVVVDEEQRFGVGQKERLKRFRTQVDVLALSATPIPRTLNMSLTGVRDLSIIETPPKDRLAIQTVVVKFSQNIIRSAIDLELKRQGQVFFVHNSVKTIHSIAEMLRKAVPEARIAVGHGQMNEQQLERVMVGFFNYQYDILVSTTIIENGLDIPRVNTLIINRADRFGLSQLYQLRGRVGRSNRRAYAYLLCPPKETLTTHARKRLAAIREFSDLGMGFRIAALDLEIRGAGSLLGAQQHGHIHAVGLELYMRLLEQTIKELKGEEVLDEIHPSVDLRLDIQIPDHYIPDSNLRLWLYKRVASVQESSGLENLRADTIDRFGKYPRSVANLFEYAQLSLRSRELRILSMDRMKDRLVVKFRQDTPVAAEKIVSMANQNPALSVRPDRVVVLEIKVQRASDIFAALHQLLDQLGAAR
ncbi:MAG: transcription-repair coupling factor [Acidobacteriota bacterium]